MSSIPRQLATFAAVLAVLYAGGWIAGSIIGPTGHGGGEEMHQTAQTHEASTDDMGAHGEGAAMAPAGLGVTEGGLRLVVARSEFALGRSQSIEFRIDGQNGQAVSDFDVEHDKRMHLIVISRDLTGFQHLHPTMGPDGTWSTPIRFADASSYRVFADFKTAGQSHTLGTDVSVPGTFDPQPLPAPATTATTDNGYEVAMTKADGETRFTVQRNGQAIEDIEPYLGARGHLVALREGDLAFLHVHPTSAESEGRDIRFQVEYPSDGRYRLFLQFKHDGAVHTAAFTEYTGSSAQGASHDHSD
jgi:hypothetical protein